MSHKIEVKIQFDIGIDKAKHMANAQNSLLLAGVYFDSGIAPGAESRIIVDWEFDWSLTGAEVTLKPALAGYIETLEALLREGADGFGKVLIQTSDEPAVENWQKRCKKVLGVLAK